MIKKLGIILPWERHLPSAESEVVNRMEVACESLGIELIITDMQGRVIKHKSETKGIQTITDLHPDVDLCIHTHFATRKNQDYFSAFTLWNPPDLLFPWRAWDQHMQNYINHDDYLSSDGPAAIEHTRQMQRQHDLPEFDDNFKLYPSPPKSMVRKPRLLDLKELRLFYCGTAWERSAGRTFRHKKLFKDLDACDFFDIYGPEKANGLYPWEGFTSYCGELPFDGVSTLKAINKCGITLALSSASHQKAGIMSNRIFEATAGGSLVITDKNDFVEKNFGDTVIQVNNYGDAEETLREVLDAVNWAQSNIAEAQKRAEASQHIFLERFELTHGLKEIGKQLKGRKVHRKKNLYARTETEVITVIMIWDSRELDNILLSIEQINKQLYKNIQVVFACDVEHAMAARKLLKKHLKSSIDFKVCSDRVFNWNKPRQALEGRIKSMGSILASSLPKVEGNLFSVLKADEIWFKEHLTLLKRRLEGNKTATLAYTGLASEVFNTDEYVEHYHQDFFKKYDISRLVEFRDRESLAQTLIRKDRLMEILRPETLIYADYLEFHYIMLLAKIKGSIVFSPVQSFQKRVYLDNNKNNYVHKNILYEDQKTYIRGYFISSPEVSNAVAHIAEHGIITAAEGQLQRGLIRLSDFSHEDKLALFDAGLKKFFFRLWRNIKTAPNKAARQVKRLFS